MAWLSSWKLRLCPTLCIVDNRAGCIRFRTVLEFVLGFVLECALDFVLEFVLDFLCIVVAVVVVIVDVDDESLPYGYCMYAVVSTMQWFARCTSETILSSADGACRRPVSFLRMMRFYAVGAWPLADSERLPVGSRPMSAVDRQEEIKDGSAKVKLR